MKFLDWLKKREGFVELAKWIDLSPKARVADSYEQLREAVVFNGGPSKELTGAWRTFNSDGPTCYSCGGTRAPRSRSGLCRKCAVKRNRRRHHGWVKAQIEERTGKKVRQRKDDN